MLRPAPGLLFWMMLVQFLKFNFLKKYICRPQVVSTMVFSSHFSRFSTVEPITKGLSFLSMQFFYKEKIEKTKFYLVKPGTQLSILGFEGLN